MLVTRTPDALRALSKDKPIVPESVERCLRSKFGVEMDAATDAMAHLAKALLPKELAERAYTLYEKFRPAIPAGVEGLGAAGNLALAKIMKLATVN